MLRIACAPDKIVLAETHTDLIELGKVLEGDATVSLKPVHLYLGEQTQPGLQLRQVVRSVRQASTTQHEAEQTTGAMTAKVAQSSRGDSGSDSIDGCNCARVANQ